MNPVISDLELRISATAAEADLRSRQRVAATSNPGLGSFIVRSVRQFINPRKYALDTVTARQATRPVTATAAAALTVLSERRAIPESDLPLAA